MELTDAVVVSARFETLVAVADVSAGKIFAGTVLAHRSWSRTLVHIATYVVAKCIAGLAFAPVHYLFISLELGIKCAIRRD